jgi:hypothetical protein
MTTTEVKRVVGPKLPHVPVRGCSVSPMVPFATPRLPPRGYLVFERYYETTTTAARTPGASVSLAGTRRNVRFRVAANLSRVGVTSHWVSSTGFILLSLVSSSSVCWREPLLSATPTPISATSVYSAFNSKFPPARSFAAAELWPGSRGGRQTEA